MVVWECKGVWRGVTAVSTLRDDFTFIESVSLRKYDTFSYTHTSPILFQPYFPSASFYQKIQEFISRISKVL